MVIAPPLPPEWNSDNAVVLKEFLSTPTGERLQQVIAFHCPPFLDGKDVNMTLVASGKRAGYEEALAFLTSLTTVQPEQPQEQFSDNYPSLDDDSKWEDSQPNTPKK